MKKILFLLSFSLSFPIIILAQGNYRIDILASPWEKDKDGYICLDLPATNEYSSLPAEFKGLKYFSIFNIPFQIKSETAGKFSTTKEGKETISLNAPIGTYKILFVMFADFPHEESGRSWDLPTPITLLNEPERAIVQLLYSDGETDEVIPINADYKCYGISHGRSLYSIAAKNGKSIAKMVFADNMRNASFQILAATANKKLLPRIALPNNQTIWYPPVKKVNLTQASFRFDTANGISWKSIESEMIPETMNLEEQPVFMFVVDSLKISSKEWMLTNKKIEWAIKQEDGQPYRDYGSYVECLYVKGWRDYLVSRYKEVQKITGAKGMYCDELGMSLRSRVCYDPTHGHEVPVYMSRGENLLMQDIKAALPQIAV